MNEHIIEFLHHGTYKNSISWYNSHEKFPEYLEKYESQKTGDVN